jgi:hypothetical protein
VGSSIANCPSSQWRAISGGWAYGKEPLLEGIVNFNAPINGGRGWQVIMTNPPQNKGRSFQAVVVCLKVT